MSEWISVKDRLPEKAGRYLVYEIMPKHMHNLAAHNYPYPCCVPNIAYYQKYCDGWQFNSIDDRNPNPTHWMPLPEPPISNISISGDPSTSICHKLNEDVKFLEKD